MTGRWTACALLVLVITMLPSIGWAQVDESRLIDLTHAFDERTLAWPGNEPFQWKESAWGRSASGAWYAAGKFSMAEHSGTHLDAPIHFAEGKHTVDAIPLERLIGRAVVVPVESSVTKNPDYRLTVQDLQQWESQYGRIPRGAIVLLRTGWAAHWPDRQKYFGSKTPEDARSLHFPGYSREAAEWLVRERNIKGVGIDTASIDHGPSRDFPVHRVLGEANVYGLENLANLDRVPVTGATLIALPIKIAGGTGGPVRIVAILMEEEGRMLP